MGKVIELQPKLARRAYRRQGAEAKAHMGELHSVDGQMVERLLAERAAEVTCPAVKRFAAEHGIPFETACEALGVNPDLWRGNPDRERR